MSVPYIEAAREAVIVAAKEWAAAVSQRQQHEATGRLFIAVRALTIVENA